MCIWDLQCFQSYPNCNLFCIFFLLRNFYSGDAPLGNYGKHCLAHHFQHCAHCVDQIYSIFKVFEIAVCLEHFGFFWIFELRWFSPASYGLTLFKSSFPTLRTVCIWDLHYFWSLRNCSLFCTFWLIRNFNSGHEQHVNYGQYSLNDHYQHCAHSI